MTQDLGQRMQDEWNERALLDPMHHVLNSKGLHEWTREDFLATGSSNATLYLDPFCTVHGIDSKALICLEIGCGAGRESGALAKRFKGVIALDVSDEMIKVARQNCTSRKVRFVRGNGVNLDVVEDGSVGFAYSFIVFQHIPDPEVQYTYMREVARVLQPGGWFLLHLYSDEAGYDERLAKWRERAEAHELRGWSEAAWREFEGNRFETSMQTAVNVERTLAVLSEAGLTVVFNQDPNTAKWLVGGRKR